MKSRCRIACCRAEPAQVSPGEAFSLIEVLAAVTVLAVIVTVVSVLFANVDEVWLRGRGETESHASGRAAVATMSEQLRYAVADDALSFVLRDDCVRSDPPAVSCGLTNSEICFIMAAPPARTGVLQRAAQRVHFWVREATNAAGGTGTYELVAGYESVDDSLPPSDSANCYWNPLWFEDEPDGGAGRPTRQGVLARGVACFRAVWSDPAYGLSREYYSTNNNHRLPPHLDLFLELLDESHARRAAALTGQEALEFVNANVRRYTTRVHLHTPRGYGAP